MTRTLALLLLLPAAARADGRFFAAPKAGVAGPTSKLGATAFLGAEVGWVTPGFDDHLAVALEVNWMRPETSGSIVEPPRATGNYTLSDSQIGVLLSAIYRLDNLVPRLTPYAGGGPGLFWHRATTTAFGSQYVETVGRIGFQLLSGADFVLGPGAIFGELRYTFSRVDFVSTGLSNAGSTLGFGAGYRLRF